MAGYMKIADLMTKHAELATFQRFDSLNVVNILFLQAELVRLELDLRKSMKTDLESGNAPNVPEQGDTQSIANDPTPNERHKVDSHGNNNVHTDSTIPLETLRENISVESLSSLGSDNNARAESANDWYLLANFIDSPTWEIMLKTREKLKEYGRFGPRSL
jgi:hypothetical protein